MLIQVTGLRSAVHQLLRHYSLTEGSVFKCKETICERIRNSTFHKVENSSVQRNHKKLVYVICA